MGPAPGLLSGAGQRRPAGVFSRPRKNSSQTIVKVFTKDYHDRCREPEVDGRRARIAPQERCHLVRRGIPPSCALRCSTTLWVVVEDRRAPGPRSSPGTHQDQPAGLRAPAPRPEAPGPGGGPVPSEDARVHEVQGRTPRWRRRSHPTAILSASSPSRAKVVFRWRTPARGSLSKPDGTTSSSPVPLFHRRLRGRRPFLSEARPQGWAWRGAGRRDRHRDPRHPSARTALARPLSKRFAKKCCPDTTFWQNASGGPARALAIRVGRGASPGLGDQGGAGGQPRASAIRVGRGASRGHRRS